MDGFISVNLMVNIFIGVKKLMSGNVGTRETRSISTALFFPPK